jgi:hypothetical protein
MRRVLLAMTLVLSACGGARGSDEGEPAARAVPMSQSPAARALRLPRMRPARVIAPAAGADIAMLNVRIEVSGTMPADTTVQARSIDPACGESFVDTAVVHTGNAVAGALVWIEGAGTVFSTIADGEHRPTVILEQCRLQPRVQLAAQGSTVQLVMHDARGERLVLVPSALSTPIDTISFNAEGQLVPVRQRTDSVGVLGIYAIHLPWARAFVAVAPTGVSAISDMTGAAKFSIDRTAGRVSVRAWHPSLGVASGTLNPSRGGAEQSITLTFRR